MILSNRPYILLIGVYTMFGSILGAKNCANCGKLLAGHKVEKYAGKSFCSKRCADIYTHKDLGKLEK